MSSSSPHGTRARYVAGCHCLPCTAANRAYRRAALACARQRTRLAPATGQRWTPAEDDYLLNGPGTVLDRAVHLRRSYLAAAKRLTQLRAQ